MLRTEKNKNITNSDYLNWQNKLVDQNLNIKYLVLYNASAKDANATIVDRKKLDLEFIVESKGYAYNTNSLSEAHYITSILNSSLPNLMMKAFQSRGLFGARDVHKKILDIYFPKYDGKDKVHQKLAELGKTCHTKAAKYLEDNPPQQALTAMHLGKLRTDIKKYLSVEMEEIDGWVKQVVG